MQDMPTYARKLHWADQHIARLDALIADFAARHPYEVRQTIENGEEVNRFHFTEQPHPDIPLIVGDILANLRSGLDHLIGALVPANQRRDVLFPILREPIWEISAEEAEKSPARKKDRGRWDSLTKRLIHPEAEHVLRSIQPLSFRVQPPHMHPLDVLNRLSNADRHRQLSVVRIGLDNPSAKLVLRGGIGLVDAEAVQPDTDPALAQFTALGDGAILPLDPIAKYIKLRGQAVVALKINNSETLIRIPREFHVLSDWLQTAALEPLSKYAVNDGG